MDRINVSEAITAGSVKPCLCGPEAMARLSRKGIKRVKEKAIEQVRVISDIAQDYLRCVQSVDDNVGRLMEWLKANGLDKNTIIIYTSDSGILPG
jgi:arylsulfatase A-like enzyme